MTAIRHGGKTSRRPANARRFTEIEALTTGYAATAAACSLAGRLQVARRKKAA